MNNVDLNHRLMAEAEEIMEEARNALERQSWNLVVRGSQEVVELSLKGLLKLMGVEYPKAHDVGKLFVRVCQQKKVSIEQEVLAEMRRISAQLVADRAPAFYLEREYSQEQADEALRSASKVLEEVKRLAGKLKETPQASTSSETTKSLEEQPSNSEE